MMKRGKHTHNKESEDNLSQIPDSVLLHILSFLETKEAIRTSILSKRWKHLWKYLPTLTLNGRSFNYSKGFAKFVNRILSNRDSSTALQSLEFHNFGYNNLLKRISKYAVSHNIQRLQIHVISDIERIPSCIFSCQTLTSLHLRVQPKFYPGTKPFPCSLNFPALTTLYLGYVAFSRRDNGLVEPFSECRKLISLVISRCEVVDGQNLCISSTTLVNLTIRTYCNRKLAVLKFELNTPSLCSFDFWGIPLQKLCGSNSSFTCLTHVSIFMWSISTDVPLVLLNWLIELANIKSLTVSSSALEVS
jgi:hypothetical protein